MLKLPKLSPKQRYFQIFSTNTDVGKTILTTGLVRGSLNLGKATNYLKPIQTGYPKDCDSRYIYYYYYYCIYAYTQ
jgi:dethiobiotin synthetase/adenosylmethionine--8-amino-7-oxononanoate aminotransferase